MRLRVAFAVAASSTLGTGLLLTRCSGDGQSVDAGEERVIQDARADVIETNDASDASDWDGNPCSLYGDWPGFRRLKEFDPCMPVDVLADQDAGYSMSWTDCGDAGIAGCTELVTPFGQQSIYSYATYDDAGSGSALYFSQALNKFSGQGQYDVVDLKTFVRLGEWRADTGYDNNSQFFLTNSTNATTAFLGYKGTLCVDFAPAQRLYSNPLTLSSFPSAPTQPINWALSDSIMAWQPLSAPYAICKVDAGTCVPMNLGSVGVTPYLSFAWHDVAFGVAEHGTTGWAQEYVMFSDGSIKLLRSNPNAHIWAMTTDGITLVWKEVYGSTDFMTAQTTAEVWKAPITTDKATLDATAVKVTTLPSAGLGGGPGLGDVALFNGLYATSLTGQLYVTDIVTGQTQAVPVGPAPIVMGLPYVDRKELWEVTRTVSYQNYLARIPFAQTWQ